MQTTGEFHSDSLRELDDLTAFLLSPSSPAAVQGSGNVAGPHYCGPSSDLSRWQGCMSTAQPVVQLTPAVNKAMPTPEPVSSYVLPGERQRVHTAWQNS